MAGNEPFFLGGASILVLIQHLKHPQIDPKEERATKALIASMISTFTNNPTPQYMPEAAMLSSIITYDQYQDLMLIFAHTIISGTTDRTNVPPKVLQCFACVLCHAPDTLSASDSKLGSVLGSLCVRLKNAGPWADPQTQYELVSILSIVLDAMVDIKISGIGRETLHEPLLNQLKDLQDHREPRLAQASRYSYQALCRVSDDEGPYEKLWRYSWDLIQATANIAGVIPTMDMTKVTDATPHVMELLKLFKNLVDGLQTVYDESQNMSEIVQGIIQDIKSLSQKSWYTALRYTKLFIEAGAFQMLEYFTQQTPFVNQRTFGVAYMLNLNKPG